MNTGDYVRTKDGFIGKITSIENNERVHLFEKSIYTDNYEYLDLVLEESIAKSSPNIIDLIEVGDILVIKDFVDDACMIFNDIYLIQNEQQLLNIKSDLEKNKNKMLHSIVTKEQFSSMEYKINE